MSCRQTAVKWRRELDRIPTRTVGQRFCSILYRLSQCNVTVTWINKGPSFGAKTLCHSPRVGFFPSFAMPMCRNHMHFFALARKFYAIVHALGFSRRLLCQCVEITCTFYCFQVLLA